MPPLPLQRMRLSYNFLIYLSYLHQHANQVDFLLLLRSVSPEKAKHVRKRYSAAYDSESQESASTLFGTSTKSHHLSFADRKGMKRLAELQEVRAKLRQEEIVNKYLQSSLVNHKAMKADIRRKFQRYRARVSEKARLVSVEVPKCSIARQLLIKLDPVINQEWSGSLSASDHDSLQDECRHWLGISNVKHFLRELESFDAQSHAHNPKSAFSRSEWYLIWLIQARHGMTITTVSYWVGLSPKTTTDHLDRAQGVLYLWADREICLPSIDEWREITSDDYLEKYGNDLPFFIDGAHIDIYPPSNPEIQKEAFNVKLSTHSLFFTILVACNGKIVWMSECDLGNMNEVTAWNTSTGPISLHEKYRSTYLPPQKLRLNSASTPQLVISGDQAYRNLVLPRGWKARITATVGEVDALAGVGNLTSFNGNSQVSFTSEATLTQIPTIAREKLFIPGAGQSLIDRFVARWQSVVEESLENMNRWRLLQNLDLTSREVLTVEKSCKIIGALCNWNLNETRQTEDRLLSPEEALKRLKPSKLFRDVQSACTTMISPSFDSKIIDIPEAPHDRTQSASVRPKRHQQSSNELKDFLKSIEHLGFITPFFISANHDVLSVHDGDVIQGVAAGRNRGIQVEIQDDQSTHLSGWIRSTLTKQWYRTELDIRDDAVDDPECACGNPYDDNPKMMITFFNYYYYYL